MRTDEKQFVFIVKGRTGFRIIETAELWEEPREGARGTSFLCYPTVVGIERFETLEAAVDEVFGKYPWASRLP